MSIWQKSALGFALIAVVVTLIAMTIVHRLEQVSGKLEVSYAPSLRLSQAMEGAMQEAAQASLVYVVSGQRGEKAGFFAAVRRFDELAAEFAVVDHHDEPRKALHDSRLLAATVAGRRAMVPAAEAMFAEYEHEGRAGTAAFSAYHASAEKLFRDLHRLVATETEDLEAAHRNLLATARRVYLSHYLIGILAVAFSAGLGWLFFLKISRPLLRLREAAAAIAAGNLDQQINLRQKDEIGELGAAFEQMRTSLRASLESLQTQVSERQRAEEGLRSSEKTIRALLNASPESIFLMDLRGTLLAANEALGRRLGLGAEEVIGKNVYDFLPAQLAESRKRHVAEAIHTAKLVRFVDERHGRIIDQTVFPVLAASGAVERLAVFAMDVTDQRQAEDAVRALNGLLKQHAAELLRQKAAAEEAQRVAEAASQAKTDFLANISHELRTPLNAIMGFSELLLDRLYGELNEKQSGYVRHIHDSGLRLQQLFENMLAMAQVDSGKLGLEPTCFSVRELLNAVLPLVQETAAQHDIRLTLDLEPAAEIEIEADRAKLERVVFNILSNAVKFTPVDGAVRVSARRIAGAPLADARSPGPAQRGPLHENGDCIEIAVEDTGIGIRAEDLQRLFQPFGQLESPYTKKYAGVGLGLALTKKLIELHGGQVRVESAPDKGSRITVLLPAGRR